MLLALAAFLWFHTSATAQDADWERTMAEARKEGTVVYYTSFFGSPQQLALIKRFEEETGIRVQLLDVRVSELDLRIRTEQSSGRYLADVFLNGGDNVNINYRAGLIAPLTPVPNMKRIRPEFATEITDYKTPGYMIAYGLLVNTKMVKPDETPKRWHDLLDPKWKGKILADDLRASGGGFVFFSATLKKFGRDYHEALAKQNLVFSRDPGQDQQRVARGEFPLRLPQTFAPYQLLKGLPVNMVIPEEGVPYVRFDFSVAKNAPHPNAARVFINWYLSDGAQVGFGDMGAIPAVAGLEDRIRPEARMMATARPLGTTNESTRDAEMQLATEIYK